jgi:hypothetical protein
MTKIQKFADAAVRLEQGAALRYEELAHAVSGLGAHDVAAFFRQQAVLSRQHMEQARVWSAFREDWDGTDQSDSADSPAAQAQTMDVPFPEDPTFEELPVWAADGFLSIDDAMTIALHAEEAARSFYDDVALSSDDPDVRRMAALLAKEEAGHVNQVYAMMSHAKPA